MNYCNPGRELAHLTASALISSLVSDGNLGYFVLHLPFELVKLGAILSHGGQRSRVTITIAEGLRFPYQLVANTSRAQCSTWT